MSHDKMITDQNPKVLCNTFRSKLRGHHCFPKISMTPFPSARTFRMSRFLATPAALQVSEKTRFEHSKFLSYENYKKENVEFKARHSKLQSLYQWFRNFFFYRLPFRCKILYFLLQNSNFLLQNSIFLLQNSSITWFWNFNKKLKNVLKSKILTDS